MTATAEGIFRRPTDQALIAAYVDHEQAVQLLYSLFAVRFAAQREFWQRLAEDEHTHLLWAQETAQSYQDGKLLLSTDGIDLETIRESTNQIHAIRRRMAANELSAREATEAAAQIEARDLDGAFLGAFRFPDPERGSVQTHFAVALARHHGLVEAELARIRQDDAG